MVYYIFIEVHGIFIKTATPIQDLENITTWGGNGRLLAIPKEAAKQFPPLSWIFSQIFHSRCLFFISMPSNLSHIYA